MNEPVVWAIVALALAFDFINGFHDAANSIATIVSTRVMSPRMAVLWAAVFNFVAFKIFSTHVAAKIGSGVPDPTMAIVAAGLIGAIFWDLLTWWYGIPSSSSHAIIGGVVGAAVAAKGWAAVAWSKLTLTMVFIFGAPLIGLVVGFALMVLVYWLFRRARPAKVTWLFRLLQFLSAAGYSLGHGGNDAQKTMGVIALVLVANGLLEKGFAEVPLWVVLACHGAIGFGTLFGGWRIVKTMGQKIVKLQPVHGFCAELAGTVTLFFATANAIPVSTTHTITGAIVGVGATRGTHAVKWGVATRVVWAWVLTIPASALVAAAFWWIFSFFGWK